MRMGIIAVAALISGCVTQKPVYLPDGRQGFAIECSGTSLTWDDCFARAGDTCKAAGYDVFIKNSDSGSVISATPALLAGGTIIKRSMLIGCKPPKD